MTGPVRRARAGSTGAKHRAGQRCGLAGGEGGGNCRVGLSAREFLEPLGSSWNPLEGDFFLKLKPVVRRSSILLTPRSFDRTRPKLPVDAPKAKKLHEQVYRPLNNLEDLPGEATWASWNLRGVVLFCLVFFSSLHVCLCYSCVPAYSPV